MHQQPPPSQLTFDLLPMAPRYPELAMCPSHLLPDAIVPEDDPLLLVSCDEIRERMRAHYSFEQMHSEMLAICAVAEQRQQFGIWGLLGLSGPRTYQDVGTPITAMNWMHEHELKRINQIKLSLPSSGEEMLAARGRIQQRIAARRLGVAR